MSSEEESEVDNALVAGLLDAQGGDGEEMMTLPSSVKLLQVRLSSQLPQALTLLVSPVMRRVVQRSRIESQGGLRAVEITEDEDEERQMSAVVRDVRAEVDEERLWPLLLVVLTM